MPTGTRGIALTEDDLKWRERERVVNGLRYSIDASVCVMAVRGGSSGYFRFVFRTAGGRYFVLAQHYNYPFSPHAHEYRFDTGHIEPVPTEYAVELWQRHAHADRLPFADAFPDYAVTAA